MPKQSFLKTLFVLILVSILGIFSCKEYEQTPSAYEYEVHLDIEGESPKVGDQVFFHETTFLNGKEMFSTYPFGEKEIILPPAANLPRPLPPNYEILFTMSTGDSVTVWQSLKEVKNLPKGYTEKDMISYVIKLNKVVPASQIIAEKKK